MKKILSIVLIFVFLFSLCGCNEVENSSTPSQPEIHEQAYTDTMTLLYSAADSFNPFEAKTEINRQLSKLLYEPLVRLDNEFKAHYSLASSVKIVKDICTVKLKDVKFSDGTPVTAKDVIYSYKLAKKSSAIYKHELYLVKSLESEGNTTVVFKLDKQDPYFINLLDFPIIKAGSEKKTDSDSVAFAPIGCGKYKLNETETALLQNDNYYGKKGSVKNIKLINSPDSESVAHYVEIGATDVYYSDLADGTILRMSGTKTDINLNNLVYIGINHKNDKLAINELRQAISTAIDRQKICQEAFYANATPAKGFFHPAWEATKSVQNIQITANSQITVENLQEIGYNDLDKDGYRKNGNSVLKFSLLVNKENQMRVLAAQQIANQLKAQGIGVTVQNVSYKEYKRRLKEGQFDLYLGEVKLTDNMDFWNFVSPDGSVAYGIYPLDDKKDNDEEAEPQDTEETKDEEVKTDKKDEKLFACAQVIKGFYAGENSINDVAVTLQGDMPIIPVCYRMGALFFNENIEELNEASASDIYFSIESYKIKLD